MTKQKIRIKFLFLLIVVVCSLYPQVGWSWDATTHRWITEAALVELDDQFAMFLAPFRAEVFAGLQENAIVEGLETPNDVQALFDQIVAAVANPSVQIEEIAVLLGKLSRITAEMSYPLHNETLQPDKLVKQHYDQDIISDLDTLQLQQFPGTEFWWNPALQAAESSGRIDLYYQVVLNSYQHGQGYAKLKRFTALQLRRAVQDVAEIWTTLWVMCSQRSKYQLSLYANQLELNPGESLRLGLSTAPNHDSSSQADLYILAVSQGQFLGYLTENGTFTQQLEPYRRSWSSTEILAEELVSFFIPSLTQDVELKVYALMVSPGGDPFDPVTWVSNLSELDLFFYAFPQLDLHDLSDEFYLFPTPSEDLQESVDLPLQRWDLIFLGDLQDNPTTPEDESWANTLIPGRYSHLMVYLGRDLLGRPWGAEMTFGFTPGSRDLRYVRLPEVDQFDARANELDLSVGPKAIHAYQTRLAMRLSETNLKLLKNREGELLEQVEHDWSTGFPYQFEYEWSGRLTDMEISLVDDGRNGGASCTDYWLSLFENLAGVCISGSRITAAELEDYFYNDPKGVTALVPDQINPFPFALKMYEALNMGFFPSDPPPHVFMCNQASEIGVPIPDRLASSEQLIDIEPIQR